MKKKKSEFPTGIKPMNLNPEHQAGALSTELRELRETRVFYFLKSKLTKRALQTEKTKVK